jgi:streptogrisin C
MKRMIRGLAAGASVIVLALGTGGTAAAVPEPADGQRADRRVSDGLSPEVLAAMQRDLGLSPEAAKLRFAQQEKATRLDGELRNRLGTAFGGSWFDAELGKLVVGVTDPKLSGQVRAAGAEVRTVKYSEVVLKGIVAQLDALAGRASDKATRAAGGDAQTEVAGLTSWYLDPISNSVVVTALRGQPRAPVLDTLAGYGDAVRVEYTDVVPRTTDQYVDGGDAIGNPGFCSTGFNLRSSAGQGFILTAGHCAVGTASVVGHDGNYFGAVVEAWFPTYDDALIRNDNPGYWIQRGLVDTNPSHGTSFVTITGYSDAPVGTAVCKSGITTLLTCGNITGKDETVNYGGQVVYGLTRHSACVEPGDSGGSNFSGGNAEGVTSGAQLYWDGSRYRCGQVFGQPNVSWYYPIADSLAYYGPGYGLGLW